MRCSSLAFVPMLVLFPRAAAADSHLWRFNELFSNADGTIQFVEMKECCGADFELNLAGLDIESNATGTIFIFPAPLTPPTGHRHLLLGTVKFAALPGAPTPDYIIPDGFLSLTGDILRYAFYSDATVHLSPLPTEGTLSLNGDSVPGSNTPTNYAGESGHVDASCRDADGDGFGSPGKPGCPAGDALDCDDAVAAVHPQAEEACADAVDNDCDGLADWRDADCLAGFEPIPTASAWGLVLLGLTIAILAKVNARHRAAPQ